MATHKEIREWCGLKAAEAFPAGLEISLLERKIIRDRVAKLLLESFEYGFSQGAGGSNGGF
jgi:hypothetical protein